MANLEQTILEYLSLATTYPVAYIGIIVMSFGFAMMYVVGRTILNFQERRINFLEKQMEKRV